MALADEILGITEAKTGLPQRVKRLQSGELERVLIMRQNHPVAVILTVEEYERMQNAAATKELVEDLRLLIEAKKSDDGTRVTLDDLKKQFGID